jgi:SAM-dependent methyltransferase
MNSKYTKEEFFQESQRYLLEEWGIDIEPYRFKAVLDFATSGSRILDVGAGQGAYVRTLLSLGYEIVGIDNIVYTSWGELYGKNFFKCNADSLPYLDKEFDTTLCFECLEHCNNPHQVLLEIRRCTKSTLILSVPNCDLNNSLHKYSLALAHWTDASHCNFYTEEKIKSLLHCCGYDIISSSQCYQIPLQEFFVDSLNLPLPLKRVISKIIKKSNLFPKYWSSLLIVAKPHK